MQRPRRCVVLADNGPEAKISSWPTASPESSPERTRHSVSVMDVPQGKKSDTRKFSYGRGEPTSQLESLLKTGRKVSTGDNLL